MYSFTKLVTPDLLSVEIKAQITGLSNIQTLGEDLKIYFANELSEEQVTLLGQIVTNHVRSTCPGVSTARQMKKALALSGQLAGVLSFIASLPEPTKTLIEIEWNSSQEFQRFNPVLISLAGQMGLTFQQIEDLFILAATL